VIITQTHAQSLLTLLEAAEACKATAKQLLGTPSRGHRAYDRPGFERSYARGYEAAADASLGEIYKLACELLGMRGRDQLKAVLRALATGEALQ
jgi:hypothetical protein